jgi:3-phenylpropionate/cinnamic acid dioxygenase small subunit
MLDAIDHLHIQYLLGRYGHALDAADWDALGALFTPDAVLDYTAVRAPKVLRGTEEILGYFRTANHPSAHHVTNIVVDDSGDEVRVHSKFIVPFTRATHVPLRWYGGDYHDIVVKIDRDWRFAEKVCIARWQFTHAEDEVPEHRHTF